MKQYLRWLCPTLFLLATFTVIGFLHLFVKVECSMSYVDWETSMHLLGDGTEEPFDFDSYRNNSSLSGSYRFDGTLAKDLGAGSLLFETAGLSMSVDLNGETIWQSKSLFPNEPQTTVLALSGDCCSLERRRSSSLFCHIPIKKRVSCLLFETPTEPVSQCPHLPE